MACLLYTSITRSTGDFENMPGVFAGGDCASGPASVIKMCIRDRRIHVTHHRHANVGDVSGAHGFTDTSLSLIHISSAPLRM